jgi:hypothetical protein
MRDVLGSITETKPAFKAGQSFPPALIQIATANAVYLFQMRLIREKAGIRNMLLSKSLKAGSEWARICIVCSTISISRWAGISAT